MDSAKQADIDYEIEDERQLGRNINVDFKGELRPEQNINEDFRLMRLRQEE